MHYEYYSEHGQDRFLDERVFRGKENGTFFECGAIDGIITSNSLFFERYRNWNGICVEANPKEFEKLQKNRQCTTVNCALSDEDATQLDFLVCDTGLTGWSGLNDKIEPQHRDRINQHVPADKQSIVKVPGMKLDTLLKKYGKYGETTIDYMSLDLEGAEYFVLMVFPFEEYNITVFDIENNFGNYPIENLMRANGYHMISQLGPSQIYVKDSK